MLNYLNTIYRLIDEDPALAKKALSKLIDRVYQQGLPVELGDPYDHKNPHSPFYDLKKQIDNE